MKYLYPLLLMLVMPLAMADFIDASEAYENKNYSQAFKEFQSLAKLGHHEAQHNLAVMHFFGQGTEKNPIQAYAWASLAKASDDEKLQQLQGKIQANLSKQQLIEAQQQSETLEQQYGVDKVNRLWSPPQNKTDEIKQNSALDETNTSDYDVTPLKRRAPRYPKPALKKGIQGWVKVRFEIHPDGTTRRPVVVDSFPRNTFDEATLKAIRGFDFEVVFKESVKPYPVTAHQTIIYQMGDQTRYKRGYQKRIDELEKLAEEDHPDAHYYLAMAMNVFSPIPELDNWDRSQSSINQHLFKAAQMGHLNAQYYLGHNLFSGVGGFQDRDKGLRWIILAAENGHPQAARRLSQIFTANPEQNPTEHPAHYWLVQAAEQGDLDAQLNYAEWLSQNRHDSTQIEYALTLLDNYADERPETVVWYQTAARLNKQSGNAKKAQKYQKKAEKLAKRLGWEM